MKRTLCALSVILLISACDSAPENSEASEPANASQTAADTSEPPNGSQTAEPPPEPLPEIDNEWALWLVNARNPLPADFDPDLTHIGDFDGNRRYLDSRAAPYALDMIAAAREDGITLTLVSSYRSIERQAINFEVYFNNTVAGGRSRAEAFDYTASKIAVPGTSEHNAAIAIDFNLIEERFDRTEAFRWLSENAHKFGFILRYPKDSTDITGVIYEPWHWRFAGLYHAEQIRESGLTLEEYIGECAEDDSVVDAFRRQLVNR
jgi:D-alanyl-D-alanine carboxypeptidase